MISKAQQAARERAARQMARTDETPAAEAPDAPAPARRSKTKRQDVRTRTIRLTVDMVPLMRRDLVAWCDDHAEDAGVLRLPAAPVVRALLAELLDDAGNDELAAAVMRRLPDHLDLPRTVTD